MDPIDETQAVNDEALDGLWSKQKEDGANTTTDTSILLSGVLYGRSVRSGYACLHVYCPPPSDDNDDDTSLSAGDAVLVRLQFGSPPDVPVLPGPLRSHIRRFCKPGDWLQIRSLSQKHDDNHNNNNQHNSNININTRENNTTPWRTVGPDVATDWQDDRLVLTLHSVDHAAQMLRVTQRRYWTLRQVQACQAAQGYNGGTSGGGGGGGGANGEEEEGPVPLVAPSRASGESHAPTRGCCHHRSGLHKRTQGEYVKNFLAHMVLYKLGQLPDDPNNATEWPTRQPTNMSCVRDYLNRGSAVLDVAGGAGHVSMALGFDGIASTIVDPRDKVGNLPGRDRKIWKRACKKPPLSVLATPDNLIASSSSDNVQPLYCQPVQYQVYQAWFGEPPEVRHDAQRTLPVCDTHDEKLRNCSAIVALHPDEATDAIVKTAVQHRIPFLIVPCCVFYRLFSHRRMPHNPSQPVSTYEDLLDYLQAHDPSIQRTRLPFDGANTVLWSVF